MSCKSLEIVYHHHHHVQDHHYAGTVVGLFANPRSSNVTKLPKPLQQIIHKITITMTMMTIVLSFWQTMQKEVEIKPKTSICSKCWVQKGSKVNFQLDWEWNVQTLVSESATRPRFLLSLSCRQQNIANSLQMSRSAFFKCD